MAIANTHSHWINGQLVFYPDNNEQRWLGAMGPNVVQFIDDFILCPYTTKAADSVYIKDWVITHTSGGAGGTEQSNVVPADIKGGVISLVASSSENDGINMQSESESFRVETNSPLYFGCRYKLNSATQSDFIIGLAETDPSVVTNTSHGIYFATTDGGTYVKLHVVKDETTDKTKVMTTGLTADVWYIDEFLAESTNSVKCWHNGTYIGTVTAGIPSTDLAITMAYATGASNTSDIFYVDWVRCIQLLNARAT